MNGQRQIDRLSEAAQEFSDIERRLKANSNRLALLFDERAVAVRR